MGMVCRYVEQNDLAVKYLSRQLDPQTEDNFEDHLLECGDCQELLEALQAAREDLERRAGELRVHSSAPRGYLRWSWIGTAALIVVAAGLGIVYLMAHFHAPEA